MPKKCAKCGMSTYHFISTRDYECVPNTNLEHQWVDHEPPKADERPSVPYEFPDEVEAIPENIIDIFDSRIKDPKDRKSLKPLPFWHKELYAIFRKADADLETRVRINNLFKNALSESLRMAGEEIRKLYKTCPLGHKEHSSSCDECMYGGVFNAGIEAAESVISISNENHGKSD